MRILESYYRINQVLGVNVHVSADGSVTISSCGVTAKGDKLDINKTLINVQSAEELSKRFAAKTPVAINLSGKGILQKQVEKADDIDQGNFNKILPNGNIEEFYVQNFVSGDWSFVSVIRRAEADKWISLFTGVGFVPLVLSLGPFAVENILPQLNTYGSDISFNGNVINRDGEGHWNSCTYDEAISAPFVLKVESEAIDEKLVIPYAAAFQVVLASKLDLVRADVPTLENIFSARSETIKLKANSALMLFVFFGLLLANYLLLSNLNASNAGLSLQLGRFARNTSNIRDIGDQIKQKENLLEKLGWEEGINKSALVDQLASLMPEEVSLREIAIDPLDLNSSRSQRLPVFFNRRISITGMSDKIVPVNEWMARIKTRPWVKNIQLENYTYNNELNTGQFTFTLTY